MFEAKTSTAHFQAKLYLLKSILHHLCSPVCLQTMGTPRTVSTQVVSASCIPLRHGPWTRERRSKMGHWRMFPLLPKIKNGKMLTFSVWTLSSYSAFLLQSTSWLFCPKPCPWCNARPPPPRNWGATASPRFNPPVKAHLRFHLLGAAFLNPAHRILPSLTCTVSVTGIIKVSALGFRCLTGVCQVLYSSHTPQNIVVSGTLQVISVPGQMLIDYLHVP